MIVVFTDEAEADLEWIGDFIAQDNPRRAITFVGELVERCRSLSMSPERFPMLQGRGATLVRRFPYRGYLIFYRLADQTVEVLHVLNGAQDYESILFPDR